LPKSELQRYLGSRHRVSEILNRRRPLSIGMIRALNQGLGIPAEILIGGDRTTSRKPQARTAVSATQGRSAKKKPALSVV
jgi:hypothetical protein